MSGLEAAAPSIAMLAAIVCVAGGIVTIRKGQDRRKGVLMLVMAVVLVGNVVIWTI